MPTVDFHKPILDLDGEPIHEFNAPAQVLKIVVERFNEDIGEAAGRATEILLDVFGKRPISLSTLAISVLNNPERDEKISPEDKLRRGLLAQRIYTSKKSTDVIADDVTLIKELIGKRFPPLYYLRAVEVLDPVALKQASVPEPAEED